MRRSGRCPSCPRLPAASSGTSLEDSSLAVPQAARSRPARDSSDVFRETALAEAQVERCSKTNACSVPRARADAGCTEPLYRSCRARRVIAYVEHCLAELLPRSMRRRPTIPLASAGRPYTSAKRFPPCRPDLSLPRDAEPEGRRSDLLVTRRLARGDPIAPAPSPEVHHTPLVPGQVHPAAGRLPGLDLAATLEGRCPWADESPPRKPGTLRSATAT
jgi:hypothetical protein